MANAFLLNPLPFTVAYDPHAAAGYSIANTNLDYAGVIWQSIQGTAFAFGVDLGAEYPIDTIMLFGLWGRITSGSAFVRVSLATAAQGPTFAGSAVSNGLGTGNYWLDVRTPPIFTSYDSPTSRAVFLWTSPDGVTRPAVARYVSINFASLNATDYVQFSRMVIGQRFQPERNFSYGGSFGVRDLGALDFSRRGVLQRTRGKKLRTAGLTFSNLRKDEVEARTKPLLEQIGNTEMIALVTDPTVSTQLIGRSYFGPLLGDLSQVQRNAVAWEAKANLVSIF